MPAVLVTGTTATQNTLFSPAVAKTIKSNPLFRIVKLHNTNLRVVAVILSQLGKIITLIIAGKYKFSLTTQILSAFLTILRGHTSTYWTYQRKDGQAKWAWTDVPSYALLKHPTVIHFVWPQAVCWSSSGLEIMRSSDWSLYDCWVTTIFQAVKVWCHCAHLQSSFFTLIVHSKMLLSIIIIIIIISMRKQWEEQQVPSVMRRMSQAGSMHPMCRGWLSSSPNNSTAATTGITEWLKKYPNSTAVTTDITGWLKKYPNNTAATTGITEWLKKYPNSTAATTDIVINITGWLKKYPKRQNEFLDNHMRFL